MLIDGIHYPVLPAALVAREKGTHLETVYRAIEKGALPGYQAGGTWLVLNGAALDRWEPPRPGRPRTKHRRPNRAARMKEKKENDP